MTDEATLMSFLGSISDDEFQTKYNKKSGKQNGRLVPDGVL
jgi:hypothetical protein